MVLVFTSRSVDINILTPTGQKWLRDHSFFPDFWHPPLHASIFLYLSFVKFWPIFSLAPPTPSKCWRLLWTALAGVLIWFCIMSGKVECTFRRISLDLNIRCLLRFEFHTPHQILCTTLATDQKWLLMSDHVIWTECWMTNLVLNVCFDFFNRHKKQIWK